MNITFNKIKKVSPFAPKSLFIFSFFLMHTILSAQSSYEAFNTQGNSVFQKTAYEVKIATLHKSIAEDNLPLDQSLKLIDTLAFLYNKKEDYFSYNYALYELKGRMYAAHKQHIEALNYYQKYIPFCRKESADDAYFFVDIGNVYFHLNYLQLARRYYQEAEIIASKIGSKAVLSTVYLNNSLIERELNNTPKALFYLNKKLLHDKALTDSLYHLPFTYHALGRLYYSNSSDYSMALKYFNLAENILTTSAIVGDYHYNNASLLAEVSVFKGLTLLKLKKKGNSFLNKGLSILAGKKDNKRMTAYLSYYIAKHYKETKNYKKAKQLLRIAAAEFSKNKNYFLLKDVYKELFEIHHHDQTKIHFWKKYNAIQDTIITQNEQLLVLNEHILQQEQLKTINQQKEVIAIGEKNHYYLSLLVALTVTILSLTLLFCFFIWKKNRLIKEYVSELERTNNFKELILSIVGHDLRTPVGILMTNSKYILKAAQENNMKKVIRMTNHVSQTAQNIYLTMEQLMQWAVLKKQKNKQHHIEVIQLSLFVKSVIIKLDSIINLSQVTVHNNIPLNLSIRSDKHSMEVIIRNLLMNAIKHSAPTQSISISASLEDGRIKIKDEGQGFSAEILANIFNKKVPISIIQQGGGLGFEIIKELCSILKIDLNVYNQEGAVIELLLPIEQEPETVFQQDSSMSPNDKILCQLSKSDINFLSPYVKKLEQSKLYQGLVIMKILLEIEQDSNNSTSINKWVQELKNAIDSFDEDSYFNILSLILKDENYVR